MVFGIKVAFLAGVPWLASLFGLGLVGIGLVLMLQSLGILCFGYYGAVIEQLLPAEDPG